MHRPIWSISVSIYLPRLIHILPIRPFFTALNYFIYSTPFAWDCQTYQVYFNIKLTTFLSSPFTGPARTHPVYQIILPVRSIPILNQSTYLIPPIPPLFLWLILLIPGLYGLRQININYTRLILYSRLIQCMFTKLSMLH